MTTSLNLPLNTLQLTDARGNITPAWFEFFMALWLRTGGAQGVNTADLATWALTAGTDGGVVSESQLTAALMLSDAVPGQVVRECDLFSVGEPTMTSQERANAELLAWLGGENSSVSWSEITGKPTYFPTRVDYVVGLPFITILATPDVSEDITAKLNAALALLGFGGIIWIPPGGYALNGTVTVNKAATFLGGGRTATTLFRSVTSGTAFEVTSEFSVSFQDFRIFHSPSATSGRTINFQGGASGIDWPRITNVQITGGWDCVYIEKALFGRIENTHFNFPQNTGVSLRNTVSPDTGGLVIHRCEFSGGYPVGVGIGVKQYSSGGLSIADSHFFGMQWGYVSDFDTGVAPGQRTSVLNIVDNIFEFQVAGQIQFGASASSMFGKAIVADNLITCASPNSIIVNSVGYEWLDTVSITDNQIQLNNTNQYGIRLHDCVGVYIGGNLFSGNNDAGTIGIRVESTARSITIGDNGYFQMVTLWSVGDWADVTLVNPVLNIMQFGAIPDRNADIGPAITRALNHLPPSGGEIVFPGGEGGGYYRLNTQVTVSKESVLFSCAARGTMQLESVSTTAGMFLVTGRNVEFKNLTFTDAVPATRVSGEAVLVDLSAGSARPVFDNCVFLAWGLRCVHFIDAATWYIRNCYFVSYRGVGVEIENRNVGDAGDSVLEGNTFDAGLDVTANNAVAVLQRSSGGLRVYNNKFLGGLDHYQAVIDADVMATSILMIEGNSFENQLRDNIRLTSESIAFSKVIIVGNQFSAVRTAGVSAIYAPDLGFNWLSDVDIHSNQIHVAGVGSRGIDIDRVANFHIGPNTYFGDNSVGLIGVRVGGNGWTDGKLAIQQFNNITTPISLVTPGLVSFERHAETGSIAFVTGTPHPTLAGVWFGSISVTYGHPFFAGSTPVVVATPVTGGGFGVEILTSTATGFTANILGVINGGSGQVYYSAQAAVN